jgi:hypothetical protein
MAFGDALPGGMSCGILSEVMAVNFAWSAGEEFQHWRARR